MTTAVLRQEVDRLGDFMTELARQALRTDAAVGRLAVGMQDLKEQALRTDAAVARLAVDMQDLKEQALRTDAAVARLAADTQDLRERGLRSEAAVARLADEMVEFKDEMLEFKDEMRAFKDEMLEFKDEMRAFKDEMLQFKDEMRAFKQEMLAYKEESQRERRQMNRQWGDLANRLGTLVEDIVAPNLPRVAAELFGCKTPELFAVRVVRHHGGETWEADALVVCPRLVLVNETKSRLLEGHVEGILDKLAGLSRVFPDYAGRRAIGVLASLYPDEGVVRRATRKGVLVMGMGDDTMEVLNPELLSAGAHPGG